mmetsp:Transcript_3790/g.4958  ORF Transcript_3790/g.4958 Transcript_3790/m.4958 type:complete len:362 (+) Transcript_3790:266-1351(+)
MSPHPPLLHLLKSTSKLGKPLKRHTKIILQLLLILRIHLQITTEARIPRQYHIAQQHHLIRFVVVHLPRNLIHKLSFPRRGSQLRRAHPIQPRIPVAHQRPLVLDHVGGVLVAEPRGMLHPRSGVPRKIGMASSVHVSPAQQRDDLPIVESHAVEYLVAHVGAEPFPSFYLAVGIERRADVVIVQVGTTILFRRGETSVPHFLPVRFVQMIDTSWGERYDGSAGMFQSHIRRQYPQIRVRNGREFRFDRLQEGTGHFQPGIFGIGRLRLKPHPGAVRSSRVRGGVVGSGGMPREAEEDGGDGSVVPGGVVHHGFEFGADGIVVGGCCRGCSAPSAKGVGGGCAGVGGPFDTAIIVQCRGRC